MPGCAIANWCSLPGPPSGAQNREHRVCAMAPIPMIPDARDRSIRADEHPPKTSSRGTNATRDFRAAFEEHMPSSGKPISHDHVSVLLLSYEYSKDHRYSDMNVQPEVYCRCGRHSVLELTHSLGRRARRCLPQRLWIPRGAKDHQTQSKCPSSDDSPFERSRSRSWKRTWAHNCVLCWPWRAQPR
jgi:hypothetical protein